MTLDRHGGLEFKAYFVCDKCDKFAVCGLALACVYGVAEEAVEGVDISSVPCYLNGMAYGSFHSGGRSCEFFATAGYNSFVTLSSISLSFTDCMIASLR